MSLNQIESKNGCITINSDDNVTISDIGNISFHEFSQAIVNISYTPSVQRAKTAFLLRNSRNSVAQVSYRNDVIKASPVLNQNEESNTNDVKIQFTGGVATLYIQPAVGRTSNIARGIVGANARRPTGDFDFTIELWSSVFPSGAPIGKVDTFRVRGSINELFNDPVKVVISDGPHSSKNYVISLSDTESYCLPFLYGYKFVSIPNYLTIKKGKTTLSQHDVVQSLNQLEITSTGSSSNGQITFSVCAVDADKRERDNINIVEIFDFSSLSVQTQPITYANNDITIASPDDSKIVVSYPRVSNDIAGFRFHTPNGRPVDSSSNCGVMSIWSDSARTESENKTTEGIIQIKFPNTIPSGNNSILNWKFESESPIIKIYASNGIYNPNSVKGAFLSQNNNGIVDGYLTISQTNRVVTFDIKSLKFVSGNFTFTFKLSNGDDIVPVVVNELQAINFRLLENIPEAYARNKRVYLYDNSLSYTMDPNIDDSSEWKIGTEENTNIIDNTNDNINTRFVNGPISTRRFNMMYGDDNALSKTNFVGNNGNLGLYIDLSTVITSVYDESDPDSTQNLAFIVNPVTFNTLSVEERTKNIWKNCVGLNGTGTAKYQVYTITNRKYTITEYTRYFDADGSRAKITIDNQLVDKPDDSVIIALRVSNIDAYPNAKLTAPLNNTKLFDFLDGEDGFVMTKTNNVDNYFGAIYDLSDNVIIMNPCINDVHFYGKVTISYHISDGVLQSFDRATSNIYFMPKVDPVIEIQRYTLNENQLVETNQPSFLLGSANVKYGITIKNGGDDKFDYIDGTYGQNIPYETNTNIKAFLRSKHEVHINYSNITAHQTFNGSEQNTNMVTQSIIFNPDLSTFVATSNAIAERNSRILEIIETASKSHFNYQLNENDLYVAENLTLSLFQSALPSIIHTAIADAKVDGITLSNQDISNLTELLTGSRAWYNGIPLFASGSNNDVVNAFTAFIESAEHNDINYDTNADQTLALINLINKTEIRNMLVNALPMSPDFYPYNINGYETLNWKVGTSRAIFDFVPNTGVGKYVTNFSIPLNLGIGSSVSVNTNSIRTTMWTSQDVEIYGVPVIRGIRTSADMTLLGRNDLKTCTTVVVFNDSSQSINVTVMDITIYNSDQNGDYPIYLHTAENQHVSIASGCARVFLRIMFSPEAWEPMVEDYNPSI